MLVPAPAQTEVINHGNVSGTLETNQHILIPTGSDKVSLSKVVMCAYDNAQGYLMMPYKSAAQQTWCFKAIDATSNTAVNVDYYYVN